MFKMIRQFTFHHPKQIIAPTLWLFLSQAFSILPAILAYMAIYLLGQAFYPPYTLDIALLIKIAVIGIAYVLLQYVVELILLLQHLWTRISLTRQTSVLHIFKNCAVRVSASFPPRNPVS